MANARKLSQAPLHDRESSQIDLVVPLRQSFGDDIADSGRVFETVAGTCRDHKNAVVTRMTVYDEISIGSDSIETGGRVGNAGLCAGEPPLHMLSVHRFRLRWVDLAIDGVRSGPRFVLLGCDLDAVIARERRKAVEIVDICCAMHPDERWRVWAVSGEIIELIPVQGLPIDSQETVERRAQQRRRPASGRHNHLPRLDRPVRGLDADTALLTD